MTTYHWQGQDILVGKTPHHIRNTLDLVNKIKDVKIKEDEELVSFDVSALFTSIPVPAAISVIRSKLEEDSSWKTNTSMSVDHIIALLDVILNTTYFSFNGDLYRQNLGAAMGSPVSPIVANLFMEDFEK